MYNITHNMYHIVIKKKITVSVSKLHNIFECMYLTLVGNEIFSFVKYALNSKVNKAINKIHINDY